MNNFINALYKLYPQTVRTVGDDAFDVDGNPVIYDAAAVQLKEQDAQRVNSKEQALIPNVQS